MAGSEALGTWQSDAYVAEWLGSDKLKDLLAFPRRLSAGIVADGGATVEHVIDVGAGSGDYLEVLLEAFPRARGTWLDASDAMRDAAAAQLRRFDDRVDFVVGDAQRLGDLGLDRADVVLTSRAVHHFAPAAIRTLYGTVHDLLVPGGFFFNLDHFGAPDGWEARYRRIRPAFVGPSKARPHRHDYPLIETDQHLGWLGAAGFEAPDIPWRTFYTALAAARRPRTPSEEEQS